MQHVENIWSLLRGITFWTWWIEQNDLVSNNERWNAIKIHKVIWDALHYYNRVAWNRCMRLIIKTLKASRSLISVGVSIKLFVSK